VETEVYPYKEENSRSMKTKLPKILSLLLTVVLLASLMIGAAVTPAAAADGAWATISYPRPGSLSGYIIAPQAAGVSTFGLAGPGPLEKAADGTLYAYWDVGEATNLYKSADGGRTWSRCGKSNGPLNGGGAPLALVGITCSTEDANILYVCSAATVYKSADAGATWSALSAIAGINGAITSMDAGYNGGSHYVVVGTDNATGGVGTDGEVYMKRDAFGAGWAAQGIGGTQALAADYNVLAVACSPNFATEANPQLVAAVSRVAAVGGNTYVSYQYGGGAWGSAATPNAELQCDVLGVATSFGGAASADIAFVDDYSSTYGAIDLVVAINGGSTAAAAGAGDIYRAYSNTAYDKDIAGANSATNITSVAVAGGSGSAKLLAGDIGSANIWRSTDDGASWLASKKDPSGGAGVTAKYLVMADDYYESGKAWVAVVGAALGDQSAISLSNDSGVVWTQISMIDTELDQINTLSFSPDYANDSTMFMATVDTTAGVTSLWRYDATNWERVLDTTAAGLAAINSIRFSPDYASDSAVFIADVGTPKIWRSTNGGTRFIPQTGAPVLFGGSWIALNSSTMIVGRAAGANATQITKNNGTTWSTKAITGSAVNIVSFSKSPDYANDSTLLAGDTAGGVFRSTDGGSIWKQIPAGVNIAGAPGNTFVGFDSNYATNSTVYAADNGNDQVFRLVIGTNTTWKRIDAGQATTWPSTSQTPTTVSGMAAVPDGNGTVLYVGNQAAASDPIVRSVNPAASRASTRGVHFEIMGYGFTGFNAAAAIGPWCTADHTVWMLDSVSLVGTANRSAIWTFTDKLTATPELVSPADGYNTGRTGTATLKWTALPTATRYYVWCSTDPAFIDDQTAAGNFYQTSTVPAYTVTNLAAGRTYYWKVCAADSIAAGVLGKPAGTPAGRNQSPWSAIRSVTTGLAEAEWTPFTVPAGVAPSPGAAGVPIRPSFQWNPADWATGYEFELSENPGLTARGYFVEVVTSATGDNALGNTVWLCDRDLDYSTTYYWHVKAVSATSKSVWGTGVFTTEAAPVVPEPPPPPTPTPEPTTPAYIWAVIGIGAALCLAVIVLIVRTRRVV